MILSRFDQLIDGSQDIATADLSNQLSLFDDGQPTVSASLEDLRDRQHVKILFDRVGIALHVGSDLRRRKVIVGGVADAQHIGAQQFELPAELMVVVGEMGGEIDDVPAHARKLNPEPRSVVVELGGELDPAATVARRELQVCDQPIGLGLRIHLEVDDQEVDPACGEQLVVVFVSKFEFSSKFRRAVPNYRQAGSL